VFYVDNLYIIVFDFRQVDAPFSFNALFYIYLLLYLASWHRNCITIIRTWQFHCARKKQQVIREEDQMKFLVVTFAVIAAKKGNI